MAYTNEALGKALEDLTNAYNNFVSQGVAKAIDEMPANIIDGINQNAKNYIATNLQEEKQRLDLSITNAIASINNYVNAGKQKLSQFADEEIQAMIGDILTRFEIKLNGLKDEVKESQIAYYKSNPWIQYPGIELPNGTVIHFPRPSEVFDFDGYRWIKIPWDGAFFRTVGKNALAFNAGVQGDAIREIHGFVGSVLAIPHPSGAFMYSSSQGYAMQPNNNGYGFCENVSFLASRVVPTANENRPINYSTIHWLLVEE